MATLQAAPPPPGTLTLNNSVEYLPMPYLRSPSLEREGGGNQSMNYYANGNLLRSLGNNCKRKTAYVSHKVLLLAG